MTLWSGLSADILLNNLRALAYTCPEWEYRGRTWTLKRALFGRTGRHWPRVAPGAFFIYILSGHDAGHQGKPYG